MTRMPRWGLATAVAAPILLVAGWTIAANLQPDGFDSVTQTISELADADASHRWVMTVAILGTGASQIATAFALRPAARPGRLLLAAGGVFTVLVALNPLPPEGQTAIGHAIAAAGSFAALAAWPLVSWQRGTGVPWALRRGVSVTVGCGLVLATAWLFREVLTGGATVGVLERADAVLLICGRRRLLPRSLHPGHDFATVFGVALDMPRSTRYCHEIAINLYRVAG